MRRLLLAAIAACLAGPAWAHAILIGSDPAAGATVAPGPAKVVMRFNSRIDQARSRLELRGGAQPVVLPLTDAAGPDQLAAEATLAPGQWTLRWQVLAVDGHLTRGDVPFTVAPPPPALAVPSPDLKTSDTRAPDPKAP